MVIGDSVLFKTDGSIELVFPADGQYCKEELERFVGGSFFIIHTDNNDRCFVINEAVSSESEYNINANYLIRRLVEDIIVIRGQVLLCNCELIEEDVLNAYHIPVTQRQNGSGSLEAAE